MIPITFVSALTTLKNLVKILPFIKPIVRQKILKTVLEAYLPQLALIIFLALLPKLLLFLSKLEGIPTESHAVRASSGKYFYFSVLNVFIGVTIEEEPCSAASRNMRRIQTKSYPFLLKASRAMLLLS